MIVGILLRDIYKALYPRKRFIEKQCFSLNEGKQISEGKRDKEVEGHYHHGLTTEQQKVTMEGFL